MRPWLIATLGGLLAYLAGIGVLALAVRGGLQLRDLSGGRSVLGVVAVILLVGGIGFFFGGLAGLVVAAVRQVARRRARSR